MDTEKAFDKVWHPGLLSKLKPHIPDTYYRLTLSYLSQRTFSVGCGDAVSRSKAIRAGVPQGSVLGPFLYLLYVSDFPAPLGITVAQFADDVAALCSSHSCEEAGNNIQRFLDEVGPWCNKWRISMNSTKSSLVTFTYLRNVTVPPIRLNGIAIPNSDRVRYLGLILDSRLTWAHHIQSLVSRCRNRIHQLKPLMKDQSPLPLHTKLLLYTMLIRPIWQYACGIWGSAAKTHVQRIQTIQNRVLRLTTGAPWFVRNSALHADVNFATVSEVIKESYERLHSSMVNHPNALLREICERPPPLPPERRLKKKRPQDLLLTPHPTH